MESRQKKWTFCSPKRVRHDTGPLKSRNMTGYAVFFIFFVLSIILMWPSRTGHQLYRSSDLERKVTTGVNGDGQAVETTSYYLDGVLTWAANAHYATRIRTEVAENQVLETYYDENGNPVQLYTGQYALLRHYDGSYETETTYLDENFRPIMNASGYCTRLRVFKDGLPIKEWYTDTHGRPVQITSHNIYGRLNEYEGGRNTTIIYVDENDQPRKNKFGYAILKRTYYEEADGTPWTGSVKDEFYFDENGNPVSLSLGQYGTHKEYDELGRNNRITYLDINGSPIKKGYATVLRTFYPDDDVETERYFDDQGRPVQLSAGQYGIKKADGDIIYLDANGREYQDFIQFLRSNPFVVVFFGTLILALAMLLPRKWNVLLLALYFLFIIYMTLWKRETSSGSEFELFWSYRQFFTSPSLRLAILNNIWLFVPFGGILTKLEKKSILSAFLFSALIESVQYVTGLGLAEFDDVISNVLGGVIGTLCASSRSPGQFLRSVKTMIATRNRGQGGK